MIYYRRLLVLHVGGFKLGKERAPPRRDRQGLTRYVECDGWSYEMMFQRGMLGDV